jgi:hypothetical protein
MANFTLGHVVDAVLAILQEDTDTPSQWSKEELVDYYNRAAREVVVFAPDANRVIESILMASGVRQSIPAQRIALIDVRRNMGADGLTAGDAITRTEITLLSVVARGWSSETAVAAVKNWMPNGLTSFYIYPPSNGAGYAEIECSAVPTIIAYDAGGLWENALVGVAEKYVNAIENFMLSMAYKKDSDYPGNIQRSATYYNLFLVEVGQQVMKGAK